MYEAADHRAQIVRVDEDALDAAFEEHGEPAVEQRPPRYINHGLGHRVGQGAQPGPEAGRQKQGPHQDRTSAISATDKGVLPSLLTWQAAAAEAR